MTVHRFCYTLCVAQWFSARGKCFVEFKEHTGGIVNILIPLSQTRLTQAHILFRWKFIQYEFAFFTRKWGKCSVHSEMHILTKMKYVVLKAVYFVVGGTNFNQTQFVENIHIVD